MKDKINWFGNKREDAFDRIGKGLGDVVALVIAGALIGTTIKLFSDSN
jgi:hypothetical protein